MDLLEHGDERPPPRLPRVGAAGAVALAVAADLLVAGVVVARHAPPAPAPVVAAPPALADPPRNIPTTRRAVSLPPDRPRRSSRAHLPGGTPAEVPRLGPVADVAGPAPSEHLARRAAYAMATRLCRDVSLVRVRVLQRSADWATVTYFVRIYEERPPDGSFAVALTWTGRGYDYVVTGKGGDCADKGTG